jgi:hypothetical protein
MNILKKLWNFLFGKQEEPVVLEETAAKESVDHCGSHLRFRRHCPDCLRAVALI